MESNDVYDAIIIGSGPAAMFAALELERLRSKLKIAIFEKGPIRPAIKPADRKILTSGWGGSGTFSDGKLDLTSEAGGQLTEFIGQSYFRELMEYVDSVYIKFGGRRDLVDPTRIQHKEFVESLKNRASKAGLDIVEYPIRHLGTDGVYRVSENIRKELQAKGVEIFVETKVTEINPQKGHLFLIKTYSPPDLERQFLARDVVVAPGREGMEEWFMDEIKRLKIPYKIGGVDIGVRIEVNARVLKHITDVFHEIKIFFKSQNYNNRIRTFCMCPNGYVVMEKYRHLTLVNGHSFAEIKNGEQPPSNNTNFAILVTEYFTEPFNDPIVFGRAFAQMANQLAGGKVLVQRLGDIWKRHRSDIDDVSKWITKPTLKEAVAGDIARVMPHRYLEIILETIQALDEIMPGINSAHTLLYFPEFKFYSVRVEADAEKGFETSIPGLYVGGDGSGYTRGLLQASIMGVIIGRAIADKLSKLPK